MAGRKVNHDREGIQEKYEKGNMSEQLFESKIGQRNKASVQINSTYRSRGSIQVVLFVLWSIKNVLPSKSRPISHPGGSGVTCPGRPGLRWT